MYNEAQKNEYVEYYLNNSNSKDLEISKNLLLSTLNNSEAYENLYNKDIADMNYEELLLVLSRISGVSISKRETTIQNVRNYIDWAISNGYSSQSENIARLINVNELDNSQNIYSYIYSPQDLVDRCDILFSPYDDNKCDIIVRCYLYLLFCGFTSKEVVELKNTDVDILNHTVKDVKIYDEFWKTILYMLDLTYYIKPVRYGERKIKVTNPDYLVKVLNRPVNSYTSKRISEVRKLYFDNTNIYINLKPSTTLYSGILYRALEQEQQMGEYDKKVLKKYCIKSKVFESDFRKYKEVALNG